MSMTDVPSPVGREYSSRSKGNRRLVAVTCAALLIASASHIASYFGFVLIQSLSLQKMILWVLILSVLWQILRGTTFEIPRRWWILMAFVWIYATILGQFLPVGHTHPWSRMMRWFALDGDSPLLVQARTSSASQVAAAFSLLVILWYRRLTGGADTQSPEKRGFNWSPRVRRLAVFGVALPMGILIAGNIFWEPQNRDPELIGWMGIIAGFWFIAGGIVTGIYVLRDGLRRDT